MTEEGLNRKMAEVMGWKLTGSEYYIEYTGEGAKGKAFRYVMSKAQWQPKTRIEQAMMVLESKFDDWLLTRYRPNMLGREPYECLIWPKPGVEFRAGADAKEVAICRAVKAAWEEKKK